MVLINMGYKQVKRTPKVSKTVQADQRRSLVKRVGVGKYYKGSTQYNDLMQALQGHYDLYGSGPIKAIKIVHDLSGYLKVIRCTPQGEDPISYANTSKYGNVDVDKIKRQNVLVALRKTVMDVAGDRREFIMNNEFNGCEICGCDGMYHVDHYPKSFKTISESFMSQYPDSPEFSYNDLDARYFDLKLEYTKLWIAYHREHATFRYLCPSCNARQGAPDKNTTPKPEIESEEWKKMVDDMGESAERNASVPPSTGTKKRPVLEQGVLDAISKL
jgi:hypothetical protein